VGVLHGVRVSPANHYPVRPRRPVDRDVPVSICV
jgi:hypothetical protein